MIITELLENGAVFALTGAFAGLMAGILGIGGGMVVVPALAFIFRHNQTVPPSLIMHVAAGTSLAVMIITSQASVRAHYRLGEILWPVYRRLWPGIVIGAVLGAILADLLPSHWLKIIFGVFLLIVAYKMFLDRHITRPHQYPRAWIHHFISGLIGVKSGLLGVGGGALIIPYLTYCGVDIRKIAAISSLCTMTVAVVGTLAFMVTGSNEPGLPAYSIGYVYWPAAFWVAIPSALFAPVGARLTYVLPVAQLKNGFIVFLLLASLDMLI
ncbi:sulfite exporter TauE/SafE family protein [Legionella israelensis]|uniref:Probable membrane transporter protein n=1 Tax=Legionella israelensis TaxID=454 RepID=A0AAX1EDT2_9GAMM|nr:sulfite exporter TauE/SafE family protein [Legionella israelensis]QBR83182.1 sulfite exporter TauE/SafE family protein [Legionella israelensis]